MSVAVITGKAIHGRSAEARKYDFSSEIVLNAAGEPAVVWEFVGTAR
jgi:hypothetical protein